MKNHRDHRDHRDHREWRGELEAWHSPEGFLDEVRAMRAEHGRNVLTTAGLTSVFRDAEPASEFALLREAAGVRLVAANRPDFEIDVAEGARKFEVTEADTPGRERSKEAKGKRKLDETWLTPDSAKELLRAATTRKIDGRYEPEWGLLIMLNQVDPWNSDEDRQAIEACMKDATAAAKDHFAEVWVLWQGTAYNTWLGDVPRNRVLPRRP